MRGPDEDLVVAVEAVVAQLADDGELCRAVHVPLGGSGLGEEVEGEGVGVAGGDPGDRERADGARGEVRRERGYVVVLDRLLDIGELGPRVAVGRAGCEVALLHLGREGGAADLRHRAADELGEVDEVAADVGEGPGARAALVPPRHRRLRAAGVVAPVAAVEVRHLAELGAHEVTDGCDGGLAAVDERRARDQIGVRRRGVRHGPGVLERVRERLLAQHVLAGGEEGLDDLAVQRVGDDHADDVDVVGVEQRTPVGAVPLVAVACRRVRGGRLVGVDHRGVVDRRERGVEEGRGGAVAGAVCATGHPRSDDRHADGALVHRVSLSTSSS